MKFIIKRKIILHYLSMIGMYYLSKTINFLESGFIIFVVQKPYLKMFCFNGETEISVKISDLEIKKEGKFIITGSVLWNICKNLTSTDILFKLKNNNIVLSTENTLFKLSYRPISTIPIIHKIFETKDRSKYVLSVNIFKNVLLQILQSIYICILDTKDVIESMNFAFIKVTREFIYAVASDRVRLAMCKLYNFAPIIGGEIYEFLLTKKSVSELLRILNLPETNTKIHFAIRDGYIKFEIENMCVINKIIYQNTFPMYINIFNLQSYTIKINRMKLKNGCVRVSGVNAESKDRRINIVIYNNYIKLSTSNKDNDKAQEKILLNYEIGNNDKVIICINVDLFLEILNTIHTDEVIINFEDETIPLVIKDAHEHIQYIISPINN